MNASRPYVDRPIADLAAAEAAAAHAATLWGLPTPRLRRRGMNALYDAGDVVLRVGLTTADAALAHELVRVIARHGVRTVVPVDGAALMADEHAVTGWQAVESVDTPVDWPAVGRSVRRVHELDPAEVPAGYPMPDPSSFPWWDFDALLAELADDIEPRALTALREAVDRHRGWAERIAASPVVCHGDVHPGNVVMTADGPVLLDWDLLCRAAPAWDHAMLTTYSTRWGGAAGTYEAFADGYGRSMSDDPLTHAIAELRNVAATLMRIRAGRREPAAAAEAERRLRYWRGDTDAPIWRAQ